MNDKQAIGDVAFVYFVAHAMRIFVFKIAVPVTASTLPQPTFVRKTNFDFIPEAFEGIIGVHQNHLSGVMPSGLTTARALIRR